MDFLSFYPFYIPFMHKIELRGGFVNIQGPKSKVLPKQMDGGLNSKFSGVSFRRALN
jgi:hypothetical protein